MSSAGNVAPQPLDRRPRLDIAPTEFECLGRRLCAASGIGCRRTRASTRRATARACGAAQPALIAPAFPLDLIVSSRQRLASDQGRAFICAGASDFVRAGTCTACPPEADDQNHDDRGGDERIFHAGERNRPRPLSLNARRPDRSRAVAAKARRTGPSLLLRHGLWVQQKSPGLTALCDGRYWARTRDRAFPQRYTHISLLLAPLGTS
jgi:hypothetical protein